MKGRKRQDHTRANRIFALEQDCRILHEHLRQQRLIALSQEEHINLLEQAARRDYRDTWAQLINFVFPRGFRWFGRWRLSKIDHGGLFRETAPEIERREAALDRALDVAPQDIGRVTPVEERA